MNNKVYIIAFIILLLFLITWCTQNDYTGERKVRFGLTGSPDILDIPYFLARDQGIFKENGLNVTFIQIGGQGDISSIQAVLSKDLDIAAVGHFSLINAVSKDAKIKAFVAVQNTHDYSIVSRNNIKDIKELVGKKFAIFAPGDITEVVSKEFIRSKGIEPEKIKWVSVGSSENRYISLLTGNVDAAILHADLTTKLINKGEFHELASIFKEQPVPMSVVIAKDDFLKDNPEVVLALTKSLIIATRELYKDKKTFFNISKTYLKDIPEDELDFLYNFLIENQIYAANGDLDDERIKTAIKLYADSEGIPIDIPMNLIIEKNFIKNALQDLGPFKYE